MTRTLTLTLLIACGRPDLPPGWEGAEPVDSLDQAPCEGSPYEDHDERVEGDLSASPFQVALREGHFRCEQEVEGFYRVVGGDIEVLVQPIDMKPRQVAGCDCLYDVEMTVRPEADLAPNAITVYRRWDHHNSPNEPVRVGTVER